MNQYLGIWYKKVTPRTVVWVANRELPVTDSSGVLKVTDQGSLVILNGSNGLIWSSNSSRSARNPTAQLLDSGNLVIKSGNDSDPDNFLWQSFDYPGDTLLPGMKHGRNTVTGLDRYLSSWKSNDDPSKGDFTYGLDPSGCPQLFLRSGSTVIFRSGPWNGIRFNGFPELRPNPVFNYSFVFNEKEMYFTYKLVNSSVLSRLVLNPNGNVQRLIWIGRTKSWNVYSTAYKDDCDSYALCGAYSTCNIHRSPRCGCMKGFVPKFPYQWDTMDWSNGCVRKTSLDCQKGDGFVKCSGVKLPDTRNSWFNESMNLKECASLCLRNCSCSAYTNSDIKGGGSGCLLWFGDLIDVKEFTENGQDFYIRMAASELDAISKVTKRRWVIVSTVSIAGMILLSLVVTLYLLKKRLKRKGTTELNNEGAETNERQEDLELPLFDLDTILNATHNFSRNNKLGEGGFGPVYKGMLQDGKEIAVKRLSKESNQGLDEFKNEVIYISKLQHRNLVKLLGCCIHGEEKMLIYEYMPNKSLNFFIFDGIQSMVLDWPKRFVIINGIARGLLYLHQDSRLRIIHRDLKADNVLLDNEMNPRISDFGMARSFGGNETQARTKRVVGTYGYMSPEYAIDGVYSVKSDVFSFGVLLLEIISGKRNRGFNHPDHDLNLLGHAWTLYMERTPLELIDASVGDTYNQSEVLRALNVGLLCVQRHPDDRPNMSSVVLMLSSEGALRQPKEPGFFTERNMLEADSLQCKHALLIAFSNFLIWVENVPSKLAFFAWEATWGRILTIDRLQKRGWQIPNRCYLCGSDEENANHLLIHCTVASVLWGMVLSLFGAQWVFFRNCKGGDYQLEGFLCGQKEEENMEIHTVVYFLDGVERKE
uniref:Receptor-like serine/threonine-protein kinase n=1 Tax=Vitis vinifera TaxID=29760 RepID=F6H2B3_VITVI